MYCFDLVRKGHLRFSFLREIREKYIGKNENILQKKGFRPSSLGRRKSFSYMSLALKRTGATKAEHLID